MIQEKLDFLSHHFRLKQDNKWRLSDFLNIYPVQILDEEFLQRVSSNLGKDDVLIVMPRTCQLKTKNGLNTEHEIIDRIKISKIFAQ